MWPPFSLFLNLTWITLEFKSKFSTLWPSCWMSGGGTFTVWLQEWDTDLVIWNRECQNNWFTSTYAQQSELYVIVLFEGTPRSNSISNSMNFNDFLFWLLSHPLSQCAFSTLLFPYASILGHNSSIQYSSNFQSWDIIHQSNIQSNIHPIFNRGA